MVIIKIFKRIKFAKKIFSENKQYLSPGKFYLQDNCRVIYNKKSNDIDESFINADESYWLTRIILTFLNVLGLFYVFPQKNKISDYNCTVIYIANNHDEKREIKLFDFKNNKVIVLPTSKQAKTEAQMIYKELNKMYSMPCISDLENHDEYKYCESLIKKVTLAEEEDYFNSICTSHSRQPQEISNLINALKTCFERPYDDRMTNDATDIFLNELRMRISEDVMKARTVHAIQHGDLSINNLLYGYADGKEDFWWIDWEHINLRPFYYDAFFFIVNSAVCEDNYSFTNDYLSGAFDDCLKKLFSAYNMTFLEEKRNEYLYLYMLDFVSERLCRRVSIGALEKYRRYVYRYFYYE